MAIDTTERPSQPKQKNSALRVGLLAALDHERDRYEHLKVRALELVTELNMLQNREAIVLNNTCVVVVN